MTAVYDDKIALLYNYTGTNTKSQKLGLKDTEAMKLLIGMYISSPENRFLCPYNFAFTGTLNK